MTGALGDVDGDGLLDLVMISGYEGLAGANEFHHITQVIKVDVSSAVTQCQQFDLHKLTFAASFAGPWEGVPLCQVGQQPAGRQWWTSYLGGDSKSIYSPLP